MPSLSFSLPYSGHASGTSGANANKGSAGRFWAAGSNSSITTGYLYFRDKDVWTGNNGSKAHGFSIRSYPCKTHLFLQKSIKTIDFLTKVCYNESIRWKYSVFANLVDMSLDGKLKELFSQFPFSLPYSGYVSRAIGDFSSQGTSGFFWSIGSGSDTYARYLDFAGTGVWPAYDSYKSTGRSLRCLKLYLPSWLFSLPYSGGVNLVSGVTVRQGFYGSFWSDTSITAGSARNIGFDTSGAFLPENVSYKSDGRMLRCLTKIIHDFLFSLPYSGNVGSDLGEMSQGSGQLWTAESLIKANGVSLSFGGLSVWPGNNHYKSNGRSIR